MTRRTILLIAIFVLAHARTWASLAEEPASSPSQTFKQYLAQLEQKPDDLELRKKVILMGVQLKPAPEVPKEARAHFSKGYSLQHADKAPLNYQPAIDEYQKALLLAPWWAAVYYHLGTAYESAGRYDLAIRNLNLYLASDPGHAGAREALDRIHHSEQEIKGEEQKGVEPKTPH